MRQALDLEALGARVAQHVREPVQDLAVELLAVGQEPLARRSVEVRQPLDGRGEEQAGRRPRGA